MSIIRLDRPNREIEVCGFDCELIYTKGSHCDLCDFYPNEDEGPWCPNDSCRHYDYELDRMIGGHLKKKESNEIETAER